MFSRILSKLAPRAMEYGCSYGVWCIQEAFHLNHPGRKYAWGQNALMFGEKIKFVRLEWDFDFDAEEPATQYDFDVKKADVGFEYGEFDTSDEDDLRELARLTGVDLSSC